MPLPTSSCPQTPPKQPVKPSYSSIQDMHCLLTANAASIESPRGGGQNRHPRIILTTTQYPLVSRDPFICSTDPGCTTHIPALTNPFDEKALLRKHAKQLRQYNECRNVEASLQNKLITTFEDTYLSPLKNAFTGYSGSTTMTLIYHLYTHYMRISVTELVKNNRKLREIFNPDEPLQNLYMRLNECVNYVTAAVKPITERRVVCIAYRLVAETGQNPGQLTNLAIQVELENTWTKFQ